jgi:hypothetical protein
MPPKKRRHIKHVQVYDGDRYLRAEVEASICCDCGLSHVIRIKRTAGKLYETVWRDNHRTALARRGKKYAGLKLPFRLRTPAK